MSMMLSVLSFPMVFGLLFCTVFKITESLPLRFKILLITTASLFVFFTTGIDRLEPIGQGGGRKDPRALAALFFDWQGSVLLNLFYSLFLFL